MIYIYNPREMRETVIAFLDDLGIDFTEDPRSALNGASKLTATAANFDWARLRSLMCEGTYYREIGRLMGFSGGGIFHYMRTVPLSAIPGDHREFFEGYRRLTDAKNEIAKLTKKMGVEFAGQGMHGLLDPPSGVRASTPRRGRRAVMREALQGKDGTCGE